VRHPGRVRHHPWRVNRADATDPQVALRHDLAQIAVARTLIRGTVQTMAASERPGARADVPPPKVQVPYVTNTLVERPLAVAALRGARLPVTFVSAPAGYGKTTLLATWAVKAQATGASVAWVTIDEHDNEPFLLWSAVLVALEGVSVVPHARALRALSPPQHEHDPSFLSALAAAIDGNPAVTRLVLDDVHLLVDPVAREGLDRFLLHLPARLRVVLAGRYDPGIALHRLRLDGRLHELDANALAFSVDEAGALLARQGVELSAHDVARLTARTEGWAAGLRMAALSLLGSMDRRGFIDRFTGDDRTVADYLVAEVLTRPPSDVIEFLLATSVCEDFTVDLAAELSGRSDAGALLGALEHANALIVRLGRAGSWYRFHALMREFLQAELERRDAPRRRALHLKASDWYRRHGVLGRALEHAVAADDGTRSLDLLRHHGLELLLAGEGPRLRRASVALTAPTRDDPVVRLLVAAAALDAGDTDAADDELVRVARQDDADRVMNIFDATVRLHRARLGSDLDGALARLEAVWDGHVDDHDLELLATANRGMARFWVGRHDEADADLQRAVELARASRRDYLGLQCLSVLAGVAAARSDFVQMAERAQVAIDFAVPRGWSRSARTSFAYVVAAWSAYQTLDDATARRYAPLSVAVLEGTTDPTVALAARSIDAVVRYDQSDRRDGLAAIRAAWDDLGGATLSPALTGFAAPIELRMALALGEELWADEVVTRVERILGETGELALVRALVLVHRARAHEARPLLAAIAAGDVPVWVSTTTIDAALAEAALAEENGNEATVHRALGRALAIAAPRRALRPFVDAPVAAFDALVTHVGTFGSLDRFAEEVVGAVAPRVHRGLVAAVAPPAEQLTARELAVLRQLPSLLPVDQVARIEQVSVNTVKSQMRAIYRKLGVSTRRAAVEEARRRGLL
jgi:LuxR family transcriptional regulator, maltose regulon positive regulatory protein